jgi:peptide/nickel transport system ATP-binding protein
VSAHPATATTTSDVVLEVEDLWVSFATEDGPVRAVRGVSYQLRRGEVLGIVGESGSGKSVTSLAVMGLLPKTATVEGQARVLGEPVVGLKDAAISRIRGARIAMIFQDPLTSLTPVYTIGRQIAEAVLAHRDVSKAAARARAVELLGLVGIPEPEERVDNYPHELSGGMRQRVVIAIAMANDPDVIIADEPTTALDVTVQAQVLDALRAAREETGAAMVLITHDLGVVAGQVDRVGVMYAGKLVELGPADEVFAEPRMPYTLGLLGSLPRLDEERGHRLTPILGTPPSLLDLPPGCPFAPRCPMARDRCLTEEPVLVRTGHAHEAACHYHDELVGVSPDEVFRPTAADDLAVPATAEEHHHADHPRTDQRPDDRPAVRAGEPVLVARGLVKHFPIRSRGLLRRHIGDVHAVCGVDLEVRGGETLGIVGESGCGKSTTARLLLGLIDPTEGSVAYQGDELTGLSRSEMRPYRRDLQIVFQDPFASLDPRMTVFNLIAEPLRIQDRYRDGGRDKVRELLELVGLKTDHGNRYPHEFSGGQRQRIGIARALALDPKVLVLDEPVSALDVSIQAGVINLLADLQDELDLAYVFVSHDLSVVRHLVDRVAVMYLGKVVETGSTERLFSAAAHPYTQALISAIPLPDPVKERERERITLTGDVPNPSDPPSGCRFRTRCPKFAFELSDEKRQRCIEEVPALEERGQGHPAACHFAEGLQLV